MEFASSLDPVDHLIVLVHGRKGRPQDFAYIKKQLKTLLAASGGANIFTSFCNVDNTEDGIRNGGTRLAQQIISGEFPSQPPLRPGFSISFVGHGTGGLYARYCIGMLEHVGYFHLHTPLNYVSMATPHLGVREHKFWPKAVTAIRAITSQTARDLLFSDDDGDEADNTPVLVKMGRLDSVFVKGLARFSSRLTYANLRGDPYVPYCSGSITVDTERRRRPSDEGLGQRVSAVSESVGDMAPDSKYPHISRVSIRTPQSYQSETEQVLAVGQEKQSPKDMYMYTMLLGLDSMAWVRVDVWLPPSTFPAAMAQSQIVVRNDEWRFRAGEDVVDHMINSLALAATIEMDDPSLITGAGGCSHRDSCEGKGKGVVSGGMREMNTMSAGSDAGSRPRAGSDALSHDSGDLISVN